MVLRQILFKNITTFHSFKFAKNKFSYTEKHIEEMALNFVGNMV